MKIKSELWIALLVLAAVAGQVQAGPVEYQAAVIRAESPPGNDTAFAENVYSWVHQHINWTYNNTRYVKSPERAMREGYGDCSERALLSYTMLKSQGVNASIVYGFMQDGSGALHDSVEVRTGKKPWIIDDDPVLPHFSKAGYGLFPHEVVVN